MNYIIKYAKTDSAEKFGTIGKFYICPYTLKIYDDSEMDEGFEDVKKNSNEPREVYNG